MHHLKKLGKSLNTQNLLAYFQYGPFVIVQDVHTHSFSHNLIQTHAHASSHTEIHTLTHTHTHTYTHIQADTKIMDYS